MEKHKNVIIGVLLAMVAVMAIGYAAFATQLNINGTANITSNWDVHIKSITALTPVGTATNKSATVAEGKLTATFEAELKSPGDSVTYSVEVENGGTLDAMLDSITFNQGTSDAIEYSYTGIEEKSELLNGHTTTFTITVKYSDAITSQPAEENKTERLTMTLSYVQK